MRRFTMTREEIDETKSQARARFAAGHHPDVARATRSETEPDAGPRDDTPAGPSQRDLIRDLIAKQQAEQGSQPQRGAALFSRGRDGSEGS